MFIHWSVYHLQDWALGVLHAKIIAAITLMGPQWWLKTVIEQVGFRYEVIMWFSVFSF